MNTAPAPAVTRTIYFRPRPAECPDEKVAIGVCLQIGAESIAFRWAQDFAALGYLYGTASIRDLPQQIDQCEQDLAHHLDIKSEQLIVSIETPATLSEALTPATVSDYLAARLIEQVPMERTAPAGPMHQLVEDSTRQAILVFDALTQRLYELEGLIREEQPKASGSVLMYLKTHKRKCLGCPHPTWRQWVHHEKKSTKQYLAHDTNAPIQRLPRSAKYKAAADLIREALEVQNRRSKIVDELSRTGRSLRLLTRGQAV